MKLFKLIFSVVLVFASAVLCQQIIAKSISNQQAKHEYAEAHHIKYGLFSVNRWKEKIQVIVTAEINNFNFSKANEKQVKQHIEAQLDVLIDKVYNRIREGNKDTLKGRFKQSFINAFVDVKEIKKGIPEYADAIVNELTKTQTERKIKRMLNKGVTDYFDKTFEEQDLSKVEEIIEESGAEDIVGARIKLREEIITTENQIFHATWILIGLAMLLFAMAKYSRQALTGFEFGLLLLTMLFLLLAGVATPMIDMEAKISELSFILMDHPIKFVDQILYFQSKSIMDVFAIMIVHKDLQMKIVGILMVSFSVIFPLLKMLSSIVYYINFRQLRNHKAIQFFVLKSGKWSMADVLVVAIFMAYIGFNGIITSQLGKLSEKSEEVMVLATNGTSLQPGFYIFLAYALLALFLPGFLARKTETEDVSQRPSP
ncbi:MAG: paraquat-inducible protein A [Pseudobdellovibrionaceae bacterium]